MKLRARRLRALALLAALALGNAGAIALALPAQAAAPCHELAASERVGDDPRCQWASPTACCDARSAVQAAALDLPALAPPVALALPAPTPACAGLAYTDPDERVPLPARSPILRL
jgi:hypothetical protein